MPKAKIEDDYSLEDDGTAVFEFGGITRTLKRPTLKQYRTAIETLGAMRSELSEALSDDDVSIEIGPQIDALIGWLDEVFTSLAGEGLPKDSAGNVDEDLLPAWLLSGSIINSLIAHWQAVPSHRGGR